MDYSAIGQTTHLAARMEQQAGPGSILITAQTHTLAEGFVQVRPLGPTPVRGLAEPIEVFELIGGEAARTRLQASAARGLTRFVGREAEVEAIRTALARAAGGEGQVVALVGEAGVGKSRLVWEATRGPSSDPEWLVLEAPSISYGEATAYLPLIDLIRSYFRIDAADDAAAIWAKVRRRLRGLDPALPPTAAAFVALLDVAPEDPQWDALEPLQRRRQTLDAFRRLFLRESTVRPLLLVFEDLHWIDAETQALLDSLVESLPKARILLLVNYRPEYRQAWGGKTYYTQLRIDPLPPDGADSLLDGLLGDDATLEPVKRLLNARAGGNPFYLEESARSLIETGVLVGQRSAYRLAKPIEEIRVPPTVQAVLAARIDRLEPEVKRLLQTAAVIGKDVPFPLLLAVADLPEEPLRAALAHLQSAEFLYEASLFPELEYTFKHALTLEVAYGSLLQEQRRAAHARIVGAMERVYAERLTEEVDRLAYHACAGELWEQALAFSRESGRRAMQRSALPQAAASLEQALAALRHLPETRERLELGVDLRLELRSALYPQGEFGRIVERLREAEAVAEVLGDRRRLARISALLASSFYTMGNHELAVEMALRALELGEALGDLGTRVLGNHFLGLAYHGLGELRLAVEHTRRNVELLQGELLYERFGMHGVLSVFSRSPLIFALCELGEFEEAVARSRESFEIAEAVDHPPTYGAACMGAALLHVRSGDLDSAFGVGGRCIEFCETAGLRANLPQLVAARGYALALAGRPEQGLPIVARAVEQAVAIGGLHYHTLWVTWQGEAALLAGHDEEAAKVAERALELARERKQRGFEAWALRLHAEIAAGREPPDVVAAERWYREALALAEELEMRPLQALCRLGRGRLWRWTGRQEEAYTELDAAARMLRAMGMTLWLPAVTQALSKHFRSF
jgi:tetratricopeptide (TPR) repeat protein